MGLCLPRQRLHGALRAQRARLGLEDDEGEVASAEARVQLRRLADLEPLHRDALGRQRALGRRVPAVLGVGEPGDAPHEHQLLAALGLKLAPQRARAPGHGRVVGVGAVRGADQARLAARGGAPVTRLELVDQRHLLAGARQPPGQRGPEGARPDDHDVHQPMIIFCAAYCAMPITVSCGFTCTLVGNTLASQR